MDQVDWLGHFLGKREHIHNKRRLTCPDGRPLYAYKCKEHEYEKVRSLTGEMLPGLLRGRDYRRFAEVFCLFAAETWQRGYEGGPWSYETIFAALGAPVPDQNLVRGWITLGLNWWRRPVIVSEGGISQYLLTIGCEGGLPVRLLRDADTRLSNYFRELLTALDREPLAGADVLARREMALLPLSLRRDVVFEVSAHLVRTIAELQPLTEGAEDPIKALDLAQPQWRDQLPLPLGNQAVEVLLGKLVRHAQSLQDRAGVSIKWRRGLDAKADDRFLFAVLELPDHFDIGQVAEWTGWNPLPPRLRLLLSLADQTHTVAVLSLVKRRGGADAYRCEVINRQGVRLIGRAAMQATQLILTDGTRRQIVDVPGDQGLAQLPWVFRDVPDVGTARLLGEGSVKSRQTSVILAVDAKDRVEGRSTDAIVEPLGELVRVERVLYRVRGQTAVVDPLGETCGVYCGSDQDSAESYRVLGGQLPWVLGDRPVYLGMPSVRRLDSRGCLRAVAPKSIQWIPVGSADAAWSSDTSACSGRVWLRCVDPENDDVLMRRRVDVVPADCQVRMRIGSRNQPGDIELHGLSNANVRCLAPSVATISPEPSSVRVELVEQVETVNVIPLELSWPDRTSLEIRLPAPLRGGAFLYGGNPVSSGTLVALERLGGTRVVAQAPMSGGRFLVDAVVRGDAGVDADLQRLLWLQSPLVDQGGGSYEASLHGIQAQLATMMAMVADLRVHAEVVLRDSMQRDLARVDVARYDLVLEPRREQACVALPEEALDRLGDDWEDRVSVEMICLWDLDRPPISLERDPQAEGVAWPVPADLEPGPWWVVGRDGGWARFRPLLWTVFAQEEATANAVESGRDDLSPLAQAILESDRDRRVVLMDSLVHALADDVASPDWEKLLGYLRLTREHPAHSLQVLASLVHCPEALALTLLKSSVVEDDFDLAWSLADEMPFAWYLLPASCWMAGAKVHFDQLRQVLTSIDGGEQILKQSFSGFRKRAAERLACFSILCDWLQEALFPEMPLQDKTLAQIRSHPQQMAAVTGAQLGELRQALQGRLDPDARWPEGPRVMEQVFRLPSQWHFEGLGFRRSVLCAPFVAAGVFVRGWNCSEAMTLELRRLRAFDSEWFDQVFAIQVSLGLAADAPQY